MADEFRRDPDLEWLDHVQPVGMVVAPVLLKDLGLVPEPQTQADTALVAERLAGTADGPAIPDAWAFVRDILGWEARHVAGAPEGPPLPDCLRVALPGYQTVLEPTWAVAAPAGAPVSWQLLVRIEPAGVAPDSRGGLDGWEATPHQRFERLLRETGVFSGVLVSDDAIRLVHAPRGETSGYLGFPIRPLATVSGRPMLAGLRLLLSRFRLFNAPATHRLPALLRASREAQAAVSTALAEQVLGALHELLRGLDAAEPGLVRGLAGERPGHLYEGLLAVLMRLVFLLYAEDRDLLPSRGDGRARTLYETGYSVRGLYARLMEDAAAHPGTMDERRGGWGRLLALFRMVHRGDGAGLVRGRGGKLFDPAEYPFLEGRAAPEDAPRVLPLSDGCLLRVLDGLMTLRGRDGARERLSYRTLDVEQIGSVYETVMGFTVEPARGPALAIRGGKGNRTPIFVDLGGVMRQKPADRAKIVKEATGRQLSARQAKPVQDAATIAALAAALAPIADERGSPRQAPAPAGAPLLQPTDERRRTGSHYTPRALTEPIVRHALEGAFQRLGPDATPEAVLDLKVCDPAMGSGAFLVEACRQLAQRLVEAWARWSDRRPAIPPDEDEDLHARRLVAQHCLYGVDRNPRAVDLARLSLWLATLARDHEFTFVDHALKTGDSLVGLTRPQIAAMNWEPAAQMTLVGRLIDQRLMEAERARARIRERAEWATEAELRRMLLTAELASADACLVGDAVIACHFAAEKPRARRKALDELEPVVVDHLGRTGWQEAVRPFAATLEAGAEDESIRPFHWEIEFPEVFARDNPGFDAIVGNPPFAGKNTIIAGNRADYLPWLQTLHAGAHGNADLVAHFFRRAFGLLRDGGAFGLIATNTIGQGDTRASGLAAILGQGGAILRATRRYKWPGEAAVVVSIVHMAKGPAPAPVLDGRPVRRISAYLVEGDLDGSPQPLEENVGKAFIGSYVLGMGFTFDDVAAAKGEASSIAEMHRLIAKDPRNAERIFPYIGGEEINASSTHAHHRYVIDFANFPLSRDGALSSWFLDVGSEACEERRKRCLRNRIVPPDYPAPVAADWPDLLEIVEKRVKPARLKQGSIVNPERWWMFARPATRLVPAIADMDQVFVLSRVSPQLGLARIEARKVFAESVVIFTFADLAPFAVLQSRVHEVWARLFSSSMKDDLRYTPSDCFRTFPFPPRFDSDPDLEAIGSAYHEHRAALMIARDQGLTKTYNRFHAPGDRAADIVRLRDLHAEMDRAVLRAYGWDDLAEAARAEFLELEQGEGEAPKVRLDWPAEFKDRVLGRLLDLNAVRPPARTGAGRPGEDEEEIDERAGE